MNANQKCRQCGEATMKSWSELTEEEREVIRRLPGAADYKSEDREAMHQWCTRCWNEETVSSRQA